MPIDPSKVQWDTSNIDTSKIKWDTPQQPKAIVKPQQGPSFEAKHPILNAAIKTFEGVPRVIAHGMTLGLSEKVRDLGRQAAEYVTGSKIPETEPYESIPQASRSVGEFVGATAPIGTAFAVTKPAAIKVFQKVMQGSRYAEPVAKIATGAGLGAAYTTAEKGINEGELPTVGEIGKSALMWGGMEGLGLGVEYGLGIRNLAKTWGMPMRDTAAIIRKEAKAQNMPTIDYLQAKVGSQRAIKRAMADKAFQETVADQPTPFKQRVDALVNYIPPEGKRGTYADLAKQLEGEQEVSKVRGFGSLDRGAIINPQSNVTPDLYDIKLQDALNTPPHLQTAEQKLLIHGQGREGLPKEAPLQPGNIETASELNPRERLTESEIMDKPLSVIDKQPYSGPIKIIGENERPSGFDAQAEAERITNQQRLDEILSKPQFMWTAADKAFVNTTGNRLNPSIPLDNSKKIITDVETQSPTVSKPIKAEEINTQKGEPNPEVSIKKSVNESVLESTTPKENVQPKEQKKFLLTAIDEALKVAPKGDYIPKGKKWLGDRFETQKDKEGNIIKTAHQQEIEHLDSLKERFGTVKIEIPGDGTFEIINTKQALSEFKAKAGKYPVSVVPKSNTLVSPSLKPTDKRISLEDVSYYNEFKPRKQDIIIDDNKAVSSGGEPLARNFYDHKLGWYSNGKYAIKAEQPKGIEDSINQLEFKRYIPANKEAARVVGELSYGTHPGETYVHIIGNDGRDVVCNAAYVDAILTKYPNAKPFLGDGESVLFKDKNAPVGVVMPIIDKGRVRKTFPDRIAELIGEPEMASADKATTTLRSSMGAIAGIEQDEEGNYRYDVGKGIAGMVGGVALGKGFDKFKQSKGAGFGPKIDISKLTPDQIAVREKLINGAASTGQNLEQFMKNAGAKPEFIKEVKAYQDATKQQRLTSTIQGKAPLIPLPKYARSVNLERQNIPDNLKQTEAQIAAGLPPKKVQTWEQTQQLADEITNDYRKGAQLFNKMKYHGTVNAQEALAARQIAVNSIDELQRIVSEGTPEEIAVRFNEYQNKIFKPLSEATSEAGRTLNIFRKEVSVNRLIKDFSKMKREMNERELEEFRKLNLEDPIAVKNFADRLGDPKLMDYVYEYWYNSILSGVPTHAVNVASNTLWSMWQLPHRLLSGGVDSLIAKFTGRNREIFVDEVIPMLASMKSGFSKGMEGAKEVIKTGRLDGYETKWGRELGGAIVGAFERSPYKLLRKVAPVLSFPTRALRAMDVAVNSMAYDAQLRAIAYRTGKQKGFSGNELNDFVHDYLANPSSIPPAAIKEAADFASYSTFMDDPGWISQTALRLRNMGADFESIGKVQPLRFFIPFVTTIGNLMKRGLEMTPGVGLALTRGQKPAEAIAKQLEGAIIAGAVMHKVAKGEITGSAPTNKNEREAFYREGKLPWAIKIGDSWYQYRRLEPFNTVVAAAANAYSQIQNAKSGKEAEDIMMDVAKNFSDNLLDSSYLQGVTNLLDKYGNRKGLFQRQAASFTPFSGFFRSINRAAESAMEGAAKIRDTSTLKGAFSQVIPFMYGSQPVKLDVWGNEKKLQGGPISQFSPYKFSTESKDPVEKELARLKYYPGLPSDKVKIGNLSLDIPKNIYRLYVTRTGQETRDYFKQAINHPEYKSWTDQEKRDHLENEFKAIRNDYRDEVKAISFAEAFKKASPEEKKRLETELDNSKAPDELRVMIEDLILGPKQ